VIGRDVVTTGHNWVSIDGHSAIASLFKCDILALILLFLDLFLLVHVPL